MQSPSRLTPSPDLYRAIAEISAHGILVLDRIGTVRYASPSIESFIGLTPEQFVGQSIFDQVEPGEVVFARQAFESKLENPLLGLHKAEIHLHGTSGRQLVQVTGHVFDDDARVDGMVLLLNHVGVRASLHDILGSIMRHEPLAATLEVILRLVLDQVRTIGAAVSYPGSDDATEVVALGVAPDRVRALLAGDDSVPVAFSDGSASTTAIPLRTPTGDVVGHLCLWFEEGELETPNRVVFLQRLTRMATFAIDRSNRARMMAHAAGHDPLTEALNRRAFVAELEAARRSALVGRPAVLFVDLDGFKAVNDEHGHRVGDEVLIAVTNRMRAMLEPEHHLARIGGDEFAVLCHDVSDRSTVLATADRVVESVGRPIRIGEAEVGLSASIGIAFDLDVTVSADVLLGRADAALYRAKRSGKGNWQIDEGQARREGNSA